MIYAVFLKGINVGGKNIIKMSEFKDVLKRLGCAEVKTYIQSGNAVVSSGKNESELINDIEMAITAEFGFTVSVIIRSAEELAHILEKCPFGIESEEESGVKKIYIGMCPGSIEGSKEKFKNLKEDFDEFVIDGRNIYFWFENGFGKSKLASRMGAIINPVTVRNRKTIYKVLQMAHEIK